MELEVVPANKKKPRQNIVSVRVVDWSFIVKGETILSFPLSEILRVDKPLLHFYV